MQLREALIQQAPSLALQRAAADEIARLDAALARYKERKPVAYMSLTFSDGFTTPNSSSLFFQDQFTGELEPVSAGAFGTTYTYPLYAE